MHQKLPEAYPGVVSRGFISIMFDTELLIQTPSIVEAGYTDAFTDEVGLALRLLRYLINVQQLTYPAKDNINMQRIVALRLSIDSAEIGHGQLQSWHGQLQSSHHTMM